VDFAFFLIQLLNGLQYGLLLFLVASGLTLVFGIMDFVNLAHGSLYMMGAYFAATFVAWTGNFVLGCVLALGATLLLGIVGSVIGGVVANALGTGDIWELNVLGAVVAIISAVVLIVIGERVASGNGRRHSIA